MIYDIATKMLFVSVGVSSLGLIGSMLLIYWDDMWSALTARGFRDTDNGEWPTE
jgi:hypothetical protein